MLRHKGSHMKEEEETGQRKGGQGGSVPYLLRKAVCYYLTAALHSPPLATMTINKVFFACDSHDRRNFCSPINQIFHETLMAASTIQSSVSKYFLCIRFDHRLSHLYACIPELLILASC